MSEVEEKEFLLGLCDLLEDAVVAIDLKGKIIHYNKRFVDLFKVPEEMLKQKSKDFLKVALKKVKNPEEFKRLREKVLTSEEKVKGCIETKDGKFFEGYSVPYFYGGKLLCKLIVIRDETERKRLENELKESEEKYRKLFELAVDPIVILDTKGRFVEVNKKVEEKLGYKKEDLIGKKFTEVGILTKKSTLITYKNFLKRLAGFEIQPYEVEVVKKNGEIIIGEINATPIKENGKVIGDLVIIRDITFRKKAEEEVRKSREILEKVFSSLDSAIFILDNKTPPVIVDCNPAATKIFGYKKEEMIGKTTEFLHVSNKTLLEFQKVLHSAIEKKGYLTNFEFNMKRKNGENFPTEHSVFPLKDDKGNRVGWISIVKDTTERKNYEKMLKARITELERLDKEKDKFISIAAHELKTPMAAISGFAQLLRNEEIIRDKEKRTKYLKIIEEEVKRLNKLTTDILDLSRIELGAIKIYVEDVNVKDILEEVKSEMIELAKEKGLYLNVKADSLPIISTDREKLKRILINLVSNAIKYTEKGGITIEAVREKDRIRFCVADTGIGIPKKYFSKMFTRFYQIASPYTRQAKGSGLGLSLCKELTELLGGKIWFESKVGKGSKFYFTLPLKYKASKA
ncbi:MAG: PAS domain S-box protein [Candidatus Aenigmatarchaeota archaeon]